MKLFSNLLKGGTFISLVFTFLVIGTLGSCSDYIDPAAANSLSTIIAVICEYLYAVVVLAVILLLWILRPAGVALTILGVLGECTFVDLNAEPILLMCVGIVMLIISFAPIKQYEPLVIISKHFKVPEKEKIKVKEKRNGYQEFFVQLLVGFVTLAIEYSIFAK